MFHAVMGGLRQTRMEQLRHLLARTNLDSTAGSVDPWLQQRLKVLQPHIIASTPKTPIPAPQKPPYKRPVHFVSLPSNLRRRIMFTALDLYGYQDQSMLKSLKKITEVEEDFDWVQVKWFEKMGICRYCEIQFCRDEHDFGSIDAPGEEVDLQAFNFGRV
ncbi:hypothetical protein E2P81_ATG00330 [Venturia nashicola]|nr:hypothetical protein E2P81_ATG00330 [Venturia nashicola]